MLGSGVERGELVEPFGPSGRTVSPFSYWMLFSTAGRSRAEVQEFGAWVEAQAAVTRAAVRKTASCCIGR